MRNRWARALFYLYASAEIIASDLSVYIINRKFNLHDCLCSQVQLLCDIISENVGKLNYFTSSTCNNVPKGINIHLLSYIFGC